MTNREEILVSRIERFCRRYRATGDVGQHGGIVNDLGWAFKLGLFDDPRVRAALESARTRQVALVLFTGDIEAS